MSNPWCMFLGGARRTSDVPGNSRTPHQDCWGAIWNQTEIQNSVSRCWRRSQQAPHLDFGCAGELFWYCIRHWICASVHFWAWFWCHIICASRAVESYLRGGTSHADQVTSSIKEWPDSNEIHHFRCSYCDGDSCNILPLVWSKLRWLIK